MLNNGQVNYAGTTFTLGQPNIPNAITSGAVYSLGAAQGNYSNVYLVGAAIAAQTNVPFILTYSDASTTTVSVNMSAWTASAGNAGETVIATTAYANNQAGNKSSGNYYLYGYQLPVDSSKTLVSVTLPSTRNVVIMALGFGTNNTVVVPGTYTYTPRCWCDRAGRYRYAFGFLRANQSSRLHVCDRDHPACRDQGDASDYMADTSADQCQSAAHWHTARCHRCNASGGQSPRDVCLQPGGRDLVQHSPASIL